MHFLCSVRKNVVQIINHPRYNFPDYDYSLIKLDSAIDFAANPQIRPVTFILSLFFYIYLSKCT